MVLTLRILNGQTPPRVWPWMVPLNPSPFLREKPCDGFLAHGFPLPISPVHQWPLDTPFLAAADAAAQVSPSRCDRR